jgi:hypothetical protein
VSLAFFGVQTLSLLSTRHVLSFQSIAIEVHNINTLSHDKQDQAMQTIEMGWFNIFKFLMISMMREIWLETWLTR